MGNRNSGVCAGIWFPRSKPSVGFKWIDHIGEIRAQYTNSGSSVPYINWFPSPSKLTNIYVFDTLYV